MGQYRHGARHGAVAGFKNRLFKVLQLTAPALAVLEGLPQIGKWVFPAASASGHMVNIKDAWGDVLKQAGLSGWRIHDLRHAFASMMVNSGASLPIVGKILGHSNVSTTQRYAHLEQNPARKAAEDAAAKIAKAMSKRNTGKVVAFTRTGSEAQWTCHKLTSLLVRIIYVESQTARQSDKKPVLTFWPGAQGIGATYL